MMPIPKPKKKRASGEGTVYRQKDGLWVAQMVVNVTEKRLKFYGKTQKAALEKLRAAQASKTKETLAEP